MLQKTLYVIFIFLFLSAIAVILWISDLFLSVWEKLIQQPTWFFWAYLSVFTIFILFSLFILYRILPKNLFFKKKNKNTKIVTEAVENLDIEQIEKRIDRLQEKEIDIVSIRKEITQLKNDQQKKDIRIVLFGDISSGKSSLINALIPNAKGEISVTGGTTREVINYQWTSPLGERVILT
ncbi:MAG: 50S ribosome-binding GTPase, partial [Pseudomonadota bacterium]